MSPLLFVVVAFLLVLLTAVTRLASGSALSTPVTLTATFMAFAVKGRAVLWAVACPTPTTSLAGGGSSALYGVNLSCGRVGIEDLVVLLDGFLVPCPLTDVLVRNIMPFGVPAVGFVSDLVVFGGGKVEMHC